MAGGDGESMMNSHRCAFCNELRSTVAVGLNGKPARRIAAKDRKTNDIIDKFDRDCRYLCFYCIRSEVKNVKTRILKITANGRSVLHIPIGHTPLIYKGDTFILRPDNWDKDQKCWILWLDPGEYPMLLLGGHRVRHKSKPDKATPLFGDLPTELYNRDAK